MNCPKCGSPYEPGSRFCGVCGEKLPEQSTVEQSTVEQSTVEQSTVEQSTVEQPAVEQPAVMTPPQAPVYSQQPVYAQPAPQVSQVSQGPSGISITGFVLSIVSVFLFWIPVLGLLVAVAGLILSCLGLSRTRSQGRTDGLAIAGIVISAIFALIGLIVTVSLLSALSCAASYGLEDLFDIY